MSTFKFMQGEIELDYSTKYINKTETVEVVVKKAIWSGVGNRLSVEALSALGLSLVHTPTQSLSYTNYIHIIALYELVPVFATRVAEWKAMYDQLELSYNATVSDIEAAEQTAFTDELERSSFHDSFMGKRTEVMVNYQAAEQAYATANNTNASYCDDFAMWTSFSSLVQWLPGTYTDEDIPVAREEVVVTSTEHETALLAADATIYAENAAYRQGLL